MHKDVDNKGGFYDRLYHPLLSIFSLLMALFCAGSLMWDPHAFADSIGGFNMLKGPMIIWATCTGFVHGMSFKPKNWFGRLVFFPPAAWGIFLLVFIAFIY